MGLFGNLKKSLFASKVNVHSRFELLREAISGTMSTFHMARDKQSGQIVGLKLVDVEKLAVHEARFKGLNKPSEGEIGQAIDHPRVNKTLEFGMTTDNAPYIVLEYLDGPGLNSVIMAKNPKLKGRLLPLIRQMVEAVGAVHKAGFIHHDICPRNFVCTPDLQSLKLIDFGLSIPIKPEFLQGGNRTGTANYMAPEVVRRKPKDARLDIYSLGATVYELCAGKLPWDKGTGQAALSHDQQKIDILAHRPTLNRRLAEVINACLSPEPAQRPQSCEQLLAMIAKVKSEDEAAAV